MSSTHDESAPDTIGIGGPSQIVSGVDPFYVEFMIARTAESIEQAAAAVRPATIRFGQIHPDDLVPCWSSYPFVADETVGAMQARDLDGHAIATLANYGIHAEELGFSSDSEDRLHLSSDWHHFARTALEAAYGGVAVTMAGAVGSVEMPKVCSRVPPVDPPGPASPAVSVTAREQFFFAAARAAAPPPHAAEHSPRWRLRRPRARGHTARRPGRSGPSGRRCARP